MLSLNSMAIKTIENFSKQVAYFFDFRLHSSILSHSQCIDPTNVKIGIVCWYLNHLELCLVYRISNKFFREIQMNSIFVFLSSQQQICHKSMHNQWPLVLFRYVLSNYKRNSFLFSISKIINQIRWIKLCEMQCQEILKHFHEQRRVH